MARCGDVAAPATLLLLPPSPNIDGEEGDGDGDSAADLLDATAEPAAALCTTCCSKNCRTACAILSPAPGRRRRLCGPPGAAAAAAAGEPGEAAESGACCCEGSSMQAIFRMLQQGAAWRTKASTASTVSARRESFDSAAKVGDSTGADTATPDKRCAVAVFRPRKMHSASSWACSWKVRSG